MSQKVRTMKRRPKMDCGWYENCWDGWASPN